MVLWPLQGPEGRVDREGEQNCWPKKNRGQLQKPKEAQQAIGTNIHGGPGGCGKCQFIYFAHFGGRGDCFSIYCGVTGVLYTGWIQACCQIYTCML